MSEKNKAGLNEVDMQAVVAAWIIANDGCFETNGWVSCSGEGGFFDSTPCPLVSQLQTENMSAPVCDPNKRVVAAKDWLEKYHQQKAEAAEAEKRKAEAAKKKELETKQEPARICGNCKHIHEVEKSENMIAQCDMKNSMVPILFDSCPDFEPRAKAKRDDEDECHADAIIYNGILISTPSQEDKLRHKAWLLEIENSHRLNDIERLKAEAAKRTAEDAERISQLEKDNARPAFSVNCHEKKMEWEVEICESGECDAKKDRVYLAARCERLTEQRNRLSNSLIEEKRRVKEVEREKDILAKKLVDFTAKWNDLGGVCIEKDGLIDRLRKENAELRSWYEQLKKDSFHRLFEALCKAKVLEKEIDRLLIDQSIMERRLQLYTSAFR